jgi:hypothetical protein
MLPLVMAVDVVVDLMHPLLLEDPYHPPFLPSGTSAILAYVTVPRVGRLRVR